MAPITDLTFQQISANVPANSLTVVSGKVMLDLSVLTGDTIDALTKQGVVKALNILLEAALNAQTTANVGQAVGEKLAAFGTPTNGAVANGYAPVTRTFVSRAQVITATKIIGAVA